MQQTVRTSDYYRQQIHNAVDKITSGWRLEQIYKFITNITKED